GTSRCAGECLVARQPMDVRTGGAASATAATQQRHRELVVRAEVTIDITYEREGTQRTTRQWHNRFQADLGENPPCGPRVHGEQGRARPRGANLHRRGHRLTAYGVDVSDGVHGLGHRHPFPPGSRPTTGISRSVHAWYVSKSAYASTSIAQRRIRSSPSATRARTACRLAPIWTCASGCATRLRYHCGSLGSPPCEATTMTSRPSRT